MTFTAEHILIGILILVFIAWAIFGTINAMGMCKMIKKIENDPNISDEDKKKLFDKLYENRNR